MNNVLNAAKSTYVEYSDIQYEIIYRAEHGTCYPYYKQPDKYYDHPRYAVDLHKLLEECKKDHPKAIEYKIICTKKETTTYNLTK